MLTTDLSLRFDPVYEQISRRFLEHPDQLADAFARAWFKLTHRDMGPIQRYLGPEVPTEELIWQDPVPAVDHPLVTDADVAALKEQVLASGLGVSELVAAAWASASTFRGSDKRGGANGGRIRLEPQSGWEVNDPAQLATVLSTLQGIADGFSGEGGSRISLADLVVLAGSAAVEKAARDAGYDVTVPFAPGRTDASQEQTDVESFAALEPAADGFRNYLGKGQTLPAEYLLVDKANLLTLSAPEMTVLVGGLRVLGANQGGSTHGVLTDRPGQLTNDFFVHLLDLGTEWHATSDDSETFEARDASGAVRWTGTRVDLVFGSNSELRALAEVYAADDAQEAFVHGVRRRLDQGHGPGPLRPALIAVHAESSYDDSACSGRTFAPTRRVLGARSRRLGVLSVLVYAGSAAGGGCAWTRSWTRASRRCRRCARRRRGRGRRCGRRACRTGPGPCRARAAAPSSPVSARATSRWRAPPARRRRRTP